MSQIPDKCKERAIQGAVVFAIAPWVISYVFLFLGKMFLSVIVAMKDVLMWGGALGVFFVSFNKVQGETGARVVQSAIPAAVVAALMYGLVELSKSGITSTDKAINSVTASFLTFALFGALAGALIGAGIGYYEHTSGRSFGSGARRAPHIIDYTPPRGLADNTTTGIDALTREPLNAARGILRCQQCSCSYHADTIETVSHGECASCHSRNFTRVS